MTAGRCPRLLFNVCLIFDSNEAKFEVRTDSDFGNMIPKWRFEDNFLVANIYDNRQFIKVGDSTNAEAGTLTTDEVDVVDIAEVGDIPIIEISDSSLKTMSNNTIVRKKSKSHLSFYFNNFFGGT